MDRKGWTRILIVVVAGLWGYNIYRTVQNYQLKVENQEINENRPLTFAPVMFNKDTFNLFLPNTDPFLRNQRNWSGGEVTQNQSPQNVPSSSVNRPPVKPVTPQKTAWPTIAYFGFLRNHESDHKLCMININGKNYRLSNGDTKEGVKIMQVYPDSIQLAFQDELKTILK